MDDLQLPGALHLTFVRSYLAHGTITGIDKSAAEAAGAQVFTAADTDLTVNPAPPMLRASIRSMFRPLLANQTVRFVGDIVAVVLAETREASVDAAELVQIEYDALPAVTDPVEAAKDEVLLFPEVGTNICLHRPPDNPDPQLLASSDVRVKGRVISQRISACRSSRAPRPPSSARTGGSRCGSPPRRRTRTRWCSGCCSGWTSEHVRVVAPDVGGGFGAKGARGRGRAGRLDGAPHGQAGALDRDPQREHGGDAPWPGDGARVRARAPPARAWSRR